MYYVFLLKMKAELNVYSNSTLTRSRGGEGDRSCMTSHSIEQACTTYGPRAGLKFTELLMFCNFGP